MFTFLEKKPHYKLKLACFAHDKTCQFFQKKLSGHYLFITLAKPAKNKTKIFVSHTLQKLKKNDSKAIMKFSFNKGTGINGDKFVSP